MSVAMLEPWCAVERGSERQTFEAELIREVGPRHILYGLIGTLVARRQDNDDCLFQMSDATYAYVHLTWRGSQEPDPLWPNATVYSTLDEWVIEMMLPDNVDWRDNS